MPQNFTRLIAVITVVLTPNILAAQGGSPGHGESLAIALHPTDSNIIYAGTAKGLVKTTTGGQDNWPTYGLDTYGPREVIVSQQNPDLIYAGTFRTGVHKSEDAALTWKAVNSGLTDKRIRALAIDPRNDQVLYAGTEGTGVFKTEDGGESWREINRGLLDKVIRALLIDPENPNILYAGTWHGVYKSTDGGGNWSANPDGPLYNVDVRAMAFDPTDSQTIYAGTEPRGVFRSRDGGETWQAGANPLLTHVESMAVDPANPGHIYVGTRGGDGVMLSTDYGDTFKSIGLRWSVSVWDLVFDAKTSPPTLYYGGIGGILKTTNQGLWWEVTGPKRE